MTVVVGTAGHIDHGKTTLLRAITGIDADRLPEERTRGMTIDVGYAHLDLGDGVSLDFVDVPGHDRYVGNMLVGAGEIDAALLVVAADDGPRPQTLEHLELLDALGIRDGVAVITKVDLVPAGRAEEVSEAVRDLLDRTTLAGSPVFEVSGTSGQGIPEVIAALRALRDRVETRALTRPAGPRRLAIDRAFAVKGRGAVVTGSLRGGPISDGDRLRLEPGDEVVRVRGLEVHHGPAARSESGRTALNLGGIEPGTLRRGQVLTDGPAISASDRLLVELRPIAEVGGPVASVFRDRLPRNGATLRLHIGTDQVDATVRRQLTLDDHASSADGRVAAELSLSSPIATFVGDHAVLREPSPGRPAAGVLVLDPRPPRGVSRRRVTPGRVADLAAAIADGDADAASDAFVALHGGVSADRIGAVVASLRDGRTPAGPDAATVADARSVKVGLVLAPDVVDALVAHLEAEVRSTGPERQGRSLPELRRSALRDLRRRVTIDREAVPAAGATVDQLLDDLVARGRIARDGDLIRDPSAGPLIDDRLAAAMDRLEAALSVAAPPPLAVAALSVDCPPDGIRALIAAGRITRLDRDLAWSTPTYQRLARLALDLARRGPLTPAAMRDATGTSRRFVLAILEDLDRREILARTPDGHVPGPRAPRSAANAGAKPVPATEIAP